MQKLNLLSRNILLLTAALISTVTLAARADVVTVTTGDMGDNIIPGGVQVTWQTPPLDNPQNPEFMDVKYGLWNSPDVLVHAFVNGTETGTFLAHLGYHTPGPSFASFDISGLLIDGVNVINFVGESAIPGTAPGQYVLGQVTLRFGAESSVPDGGSTCGLALMALLVLRSCWKRS